MTLMILLLASIASSAQELPEKSPLVGTVVRSKEYVVRRSPRRQEEFIGEVGYRRQARTLKADWALFDHDLRRWQARGAIQGEEVLRDGTAVLLEGRKAEHSLGTRSGRLSGESPEDRVRMTRRSPDGLDSASGRELFWEEDGGIIRLEGTVHALSPRGEAWAERALYRHEDRSIELSGDRPVAAPHDPAWSAAMQAESITARESPARLQALGGVRGWVHFPERRF